MNILTKKSATGRKTYLAEAVIYSIPPHVDNSLRKYSTL
jgi:hypothetical protein